MRFVLPVAFAILSLAACSPQPSGVKAIVGARLEPGEGKPAIEYSVIVIADAKIRAAGPQATTPVPKGAEITGGVGRVIRADLQPGQAANLVMLDGLTGAAAATMRNGEWVK